MQGGAFDCFLALSYYVNPKYINLVCKIHKSTDLLRLTNVTKSLSTRCDRFWVGCQCNDTVSPGVGTKTLHCPLELFIAIPIFRARKDRSG